jgi:hypothetical protein
MPTNTASVRLPCSNKVEGEIKVVPPAPRRSDQVVDIFAAPILRTMLTLSCRRLEARPKTQIGLRLFHNRPSSSRSIEGSDNMVRCHRSR